MDRARAELIIAMQRAFTTAEYKEAVALIGPETKLSFDFGAAFTGNANIGVAQEQEFWQIGRPEVTMMRFMSAVNGATLNALTDEQIERIVAEQIAAGDEAEATEAAAYDAFSQRVKDAFKRLRAPTKRKANPKVTGKVTATRTDVEVEVE
jgi:hypothetical protein